MDVRACEHFQQLLHFEGLEEGRRHPHPQGPRLEGTQPEAPRVVLTVDLFERTRNFPDGVFLGGPPKLFETAGRMQLILMLREGLYPTSKVLDVGCGCLRGGYWLINFLAPGGYCGVEPNRAMVEAGLTHLLDPGVGVDNLRPLRKNGGHRQ